MDEYQPLLRSSSLRWGDPRLTIFISHTLAAWGHRLWSFGIGLFLAGMFPESLFITAIYGLSANGLVLLLGGPMGAAIDKASRWRGASVSLITTNLSIGLSCVFLILPQTANTFSDSALPLPEWVSTFSIVMAIAMAAISFLGSTGYKIVIEKDWIVVVAAGDEEVLAQLNSVLRTIDLIAFFLAPALVGGILSLTSITVAALIMAGWNIASLFIEYYLLKWVHRSIGKLSNPKEPTPPSSILGSWRTYLSHPVLPAGLSLAFLYMTVLGFDAVTQAYAISQGVPPWAVGLVTACGSLFGIFAALLFPFLRRRFGLEGTGKLGLLLDLILTSIAVASVFLPGSPFIWATPSNSLVSVSVLLASLVLNRWSLWTIDLSVTMIQQERVEERKRATIGGAQNSAQTVMDCFKFILVTFIPGQSEFGFLIFVSGVFVWFSAALFLCYSWSEASRRRRREDITPHNNETSGFLSPSKGPPVLEFSGGEQPPLKTASSSQL